MNLCSTGLKSPKTVPQRVNRSWWLTESLELVTQNNLLKTPPLVTCLHWPSSPYFFDSLTTPIDNVSDKRVTIVMGGLCCFPGVWSWPLSSSSQLRLFGTTNPKTGPVSDKWPFRCQRAKNLTPADHAKEAPFLNMHPVKKHLTQICRHRTPITSPFPYFHSPFPTSKPTLLLYPMNISSPSQSGKQIWY